jgi:hypothetical protein
MSAVDPVTRYSVMPIPADASRTELFEAGPIAIGVEYRLLTDAIAAAAAAGLQAARGDERGVTTGLDDRGVSLHVYSHEAGERREWLRFDCFDEDPHYHYISWREKRNEMLHLDPVADGDALAWALERIRTRLPAMLARAGAPDVAARVDAAALEATMPRVAAAAWRLRYAPVGEGR